MLSISRIDKKKIKQMSFEEIRDQLNPKALYIASLKGFDPYTKYLIKRYRKLVKRDKRKMPL